MNTSSDKFTGWEQENIALASVAQCAAMVDKLAVGGHIDSRQLAHSLNPLLVLDPKSFEDIYPNVSDLSLGFRTIHDLFSNKRPEKESLVLRYTLGLLHLHNSLSKNRGMQSRIRQGLKGIPPLRTETSQEGDEAWAFAENQRSIRLLAELYQDTISTLSYRIQIQGSADSLKDPAIAEKIRALLLSGIRSAMLWHQLGGRRWRLLVYRARIHKTAGQIRKDLLNRIH